MSATAVPPGWPRQVRPAGADGFVEDAVAWLLDLCPADYRAYGVWRRHPVALAWATTRHVEAQLGSMRSAYAEARVDLGDLLPPEAVAEVLEALEAEGLRLRAAARGTALLHDALQGRTYVPRL